MRRGVLASSFVCAISTGLFAVGVSPASATPDTDSLLPTATFGSQCEAAADPDSGYIYSGACRTDNASVTYYMDSSGTYELEAPDRSIVQQVMANQVTPTDLSVSYDSSPTFSGSGETDIIYQEGSTGMPADVLGMTWCNDPENGTTSLCDQFYIRIRGNGVIDLVTAGHETGHAVGLGHPQWAYPVHSACEYGFWVMRAAYSCITGGSFGPLNVENINWVY